MILKSFKQVSDLIHFSPQLHKPYFGLFYKASDFIHPKALEIWGLLRPLSDPSSQLLFYKFLSTLIISNGQARFFNECFFLFYLPKLCVITLFLSWDLCAKDRGKYFWEQSCHDRIWLYHPWDSICLPPLYSTPGLNTAWNMVPSKSWINNTTLYRASVYVYELRILIHAYFIVAVGFFGSIGIWT
jgi:hypothetical protein